jgi:hypothetical protein
MMALQVEHCGPGKNVWQHMNDYISRPEDERVDRHFEDIRRAFGYERIF